MVHSGWGLPAVLGETSVPLCGERGPCPHIGTVAPFAASAEGENGLLFLRALSHITACHHAEVVRMTLHMYQV